jgi:hypothetical protein
VGLIGIPAAYHSLFAMIVTQRHKKLDPATEESVLLHKKTNVKQSTAIMSSSSIGFAPFPVRKIARA